VIIISNLQYWFKESNKCYLTIIFIQHNRKNVLRSCARWRLTSSMPIRFLVTASTNIFAIRLEGRSRFLGPLAQWYIYINSNKYRRKRPCYLPPSGITVTLTKSPLWLRRFYSSRLHTSLCLHYGNNDGTSYELDCLNLESCTFDRN